MKEHKTPHKEFARHAENPRGRVKDFTSKNSNKVTDKSLNAAFASVSEDFSDLSPISEISYANRNEDITNFLLEEPSSVTLIACDLTPKRTTDTIGVAVSSTDSSKFNSVESEITVNFLRNAKTEILNSVPLRRRELMDAIIEYVVRDIQINTLPKETDQFGHLLSMKNRMLFLCTFIWVIGVLTVLFFTCDPYKVPIPT